MQHVAHVLAKEALLSCNSQIWFFFFLNEKGGLPCELMNPTPRDSSWTPCHVTVMGNITCITWALLVLLLKSLIFRCWDKDSYHQATPRVVFPKLGWRLCLRLDCAENQRVYVFQLFFFFSRVFELFECCSYCSCTVQWTVTANFDFSNLFQPITAHRVLFTDPQILLFSSFFIKNGSHDTINTFKNYFATVFFSFQFSVFSCIQMDPMS